MPRKLYRVTFAAAILALALLAVSCGGREADRARPAQTQMTATPPAATSAPAPAPDTAAAASAIPSAKAQPPAPTSTPEAEAEAPAPAEPPAKLPEVALPPLPSADQRATVRDVKLKDMAAREFSLSSLKGKPAMIVFWATWCRPCVMEIPHLVRLQETYAKRGLKIVAISLDANGMAAVKPFLDKHPEMTYTVVPNGAEASVAFGGIRSIPNSFMLDRQGRIVKQFVGLTPGETLEGWVQALLREKS